MDNTFKYFAFISYSSKDTAWGKRLQKKLEGYRMPATLCNEHGWKRKPMDPVFFAPTDIQPGGLTEEIQERLRASHHLIVICSPNSAQSEWVGREIAYFHSLGRTNNIHFFIVEGSPHGNNKETQCFNPIIKELGLPEILGANIHERIYRWPWLNKERAYVQLISKLLGVEFDAIWQRHKRLLKQRIVGLTFSIIALMVTWFFTIQAVTPFTAEVAINDVSEYNHNIPAFNGGTVSLYLDNEILVDTLCSYAANESLLGNGIFKRIPHKYLNKKVRFVIFAPGYCSTDTIATLSEHTQLLIKRDPEMYGHIHFKLWNFAEETLVSNCEIVVGDLDQENNFREIVRSVSDSLGIIDINIPLHQQRIAYSISSPTASLEAQILYMPCGPSDVVLIK